MKWININDRLPKDGEYVLVFCKEIPINSTQHYIITQYTTKYEFISVPRRIVTHWTPLTAPSIK